MAAIKELYADSVQFSYKPDQQLLTGAYMKCHTGDIIGLLGRNGCGKTTFLKILFGSLRAQYCYMRINGKKTNKAYVTGKIGYLPQYSFLPTDAKVSDLIKLLLTDKSSIALMMEDVRIRTLTGKKVYQLSGGELRYLEICLLIYLPTDFLLLDEPFTGLEPMYTEYIAGLILRFKDKKGFVISDHQYRNVLDLATQLVMLENGCCRQVQNEKDLEFFYLPEGTFE